MCVMIVGDVYITVFICANIGRFGGSRETLHDNFEDAVSGETRLTECFRRCISEQPLSLDISRHFDILSR